MEIDRSSPRRPHTRHPAGGAGCWTLFLSLNLAICQLGSCYQRACQRSSESNAAMRNSHLIGEGCCPTSRSVAMRSLTALSAFLNVSSLNFGGAAKRRLFFFCCVAHYCSGWWPSAFGGRIVARALVVLCNHAVIRRPLLCG